MRGIGLIVCLGSSLVLAACQEAVPEPSNEVAVTVVELGPNGTRKVTEYRADDPGMQTQAISIDAACATSSVRLWSGLLYAGHQICFMGAGHATLSDYCRVYKGPACVTTWDQSVKSYATGGYAGFFSCGTTYNNDAGVPDIFGFVRLQSVSSAATCVQHAHWLDLN